MGRRSGWRGCSSGSVRTVLLAPRAVTRVGRRSAGRARAPAARASSPARPRPLPLPVTQPALPQATPKVPTPAPPLAASQRTPAAAQAAPAAATAATFPGGSSTPQARRRREQQRLAKRLRRRSNELANVRPAARYSSAGSRRGEGEGYAWSLCYCVELLLLRCVRFLHLLRADALASPCSPQMKVDICAFSGYKIYPSRGKLYVRGDSKVRPPSGRSSGAGREGWRAALGGAAWAAWSCTAQGAACSERLTAGLAG